MAKRREVDWADQIVEDMLKPLPREAGDWNAVKIICRDHPYRQMSMADSEKIVLGMLHSSFPEGPRAAMGAHAEYKAWVQAGQEKGERRVSVAWNACQTGEAVSAGLRRWDELRESFENFGDWASGAVAEPAGWDPVNGVDFSQVPKDAPEQKPKPRMRMRM
jgi:hypothetical protein